MNEMEPLSDGEITLRLSKDTPADPTKEWLRALHFDITLPDSVEAIGFITCNPDNWPSRKTCEWIGATLVEIVDLPPENDQYKEGERQKCRYRWIL
jgi:hypothetical protein